LSPKPVFSSPDCNIELHHSYIQIQKSEYSLYSLNTSTRHVLAFKYVDVNNNNDVTECA